MFVLVTYDVSTSTPAGSKRLRKVAKKCMNYGQRVQNSVFELLVDPGQWAQCKAELCALVNPDTDSLRFYYLGTNWQRRVEHFGAKPSLDLEGPLIA
jgi:CRISPR-associated protein Cas2